MTSYVSKSLVWIWGITVHEDEQQQSTKQKTNRETIRRLN